MLDSMTLKSTFLEEINRFDIAKGIGIILMVIGHAGCPKPLRTLIYEFHMLLFFIIAGMLYNKSKWENLGFSALIKKRAKSYLFCYFCLSAINLVPNSINELEKYTTINDWLDSQIYHTGWIVYASSVKSQNPNCSPLWFLPCLFIAYLIFYQVMHLKLKNQIGICICLFLLNRLIFYKLPDITPKALPWHMEVALVGVVLMAVGYHAKGLGGGKSCLEKNIRIWLLILSIGITAGCLNWGKVALASNWVGNPFLFLICSCAISLDIIVLSNKIVRTVSGRFLAFCSKSTMVFMGFNYYFNTMSAKVWEKIPVLNRFEYFWWIKSIVVITCLVLISYIWKKSQKHI